MLNPFSTPETVWRRLQSALEGRVPPIVRVAYELAAQAHAGQRRFEGSPYVVHPLRVALILAEERGMTDPELLATALLHDVLEDSSVTFGQLRDVVGEQVAEWVRALSKPPADQQAKAARDAAYFSALLEAPREVRLVKLADRLDNLRFAHLRQDPTWSRAYREETRRWLLPLGERTDRWFARQLASLVGDEQHRPWEVLAIRRLFEAQPWLAVESERVEVTPDAPPVEAFYRLHLPEYVVVVPRAPDGRLLMLKGYKHGPRRVVYQLPAGYVDPGETPAAAARRELAEETGHTAGALHFLGQFVADGNREAGHAHLFLAEGVVPDPAAPNDSDDLEHYEVILLTPKEVKQLLADGLVASLGMAAALGLAMWFGQ